MSGRQVQESCVKAVMLVCFSVRVPFCGAPLSIEVVFLALNNFIVIYVATVNVVEGISFAHVADFKFLTSRDLDTRLEPMILKVEPEIFGVALPRELITGACDLDPVSRLALVHSHLELEFKRAVIVFLGPYDAINLDIHFGNENQRVTLLRVRPVIVVVLVIAIVRIIIVYTFSALPMDRRNFTLAARHSVEFTLVVD